SRNETLVGSLWPHQRRAGGGEQSPFGSRRRPVFVPIDARLASLNQRRHFGGPISGYGWFEPGFFAQQREHFFHQGIGRDAMFFAQNRNGAMLDELVGPADAHDWRVDHLRVQMFHHCAAKTIVQITSTLRAKNSSVPVSRGLIQRGLISATETPFSSSLRAASSAISNMAPRPKMATSRPCFTTSALPISKSLGSGLGLTPGPEPRG